MSYEIHQQELWLRICQAVNAKPNVEWTPERIAEELSIPVGSPGYDRILEVLQEAENAQVAGRDKIKWGFI